MWLICKWSQCDHQVGFAKAKKLTELFHYTSFFVCVVHSMEVSLLLSNEIIKHLVEMVEVK